MPITWRAWTTKELRVMEEMRLDGKTVKEISSVVNHPYHGVRGTLRRRGVKRVCKRRQEYMQLFNLGYSNKVVAGILGVLIDTVNSMRYRLRKLRVDKIYPTDLAQGANYGSRVRKVS